MTIEDSTSQSEIAKPKRAPRKKKAEAVTEAAIGGQAGNGQAVVAMSPQQSAELDRLIIELNTLAEELRRTVKYTPPPFSAAAMASMLKENVGKLSPNLQVPIVGELMQNLEGTKPEDLLNPDTWKGMWYILNYSAQAQSEQLKNSLTEKLAAIPGAAVIFELKSSFEGAKPSDFLDINTWKGVAYILDHTIRTQAKEVRKKLLGETEEE